METLKELFKKAEDGFVNYRATFARIDTVFPIEGADRLVRAIVCGRDVVISKDLPLDNIYVYIPVESSLSHKYLSKNNLYRISSESYQLNDNFDEVTAMLNSGKTLGELSTKGGFFEKNGRVKQIRIRGVYSQGYLADIKSLQTAYPILDQFMTDEFEFLEGETFDVIGDEVFCEKYLVGGKKPVEQKTNDQKHFNQRQKNLRKARSVLVPGQFKYHYDTKQFGDDYKKFSPDDRVSISVKVHGSSGIFGNVKCYKRKEDCNWIQRVFYWLWRPKEYRLLYASRTKIRNEKVYDHPTQSNYFYGSDIWGPVRDLLEPFIRKNMIVYGEICGYVEGTTKMIQKGHDYGCRPGQWKFMPYRIVEIRGKKRIEWDLEDVVDWTNGVIRNYVSNGEYDQAHKLIPVTIIYQGPLKKLYPDIPVDGDWNINVLERMKGDTELLGMEVQEPLCKMKAPREGVVIRKIGDEIPRAWKLKSALHYELEKKAHDSGEGDMEEES
jgi:hypothetical protein